MSVRRADYIVIGANIGMDAIKNDEEFYDDEENSKYIFNQEVGELTYIIDGMGGEYFVVGIILDIGKEFDGLSFNTFEIDGGNGWIMPRMKVQKHIKDKFGLDVDTKLLVFTDWS